jgi:AcrR family transcriptional regulator
MVTKRKSVKVRDSEQTRNELIGAVGAILTESGFRALTSTNIARKAGRHWSLVSYYFEDIDALKKAYINDKDYWPPFFERFKISANPGKKELQALFTSLMQENFRFFWANPQMRQIILWQISEDNILLKGISDAREAEGEKLLALTDVYFKDSGINVRALMALVLGGIYYVILHAKTNKSTVAGIDANKGDDQQQILNTISQVISWAWQAAGEKNATK